jgi:hypothetical protein
MLDNDLTIHTWQMTSTATSFQQNDALPKNKIKRNIKNTRER